MDFFVVATDLLYFVVLEDIHDLESFHGLFEIPDYSQNYFVPVYQYNIPVPNLLLLLDFQTDLFSLCDYVRFLFPCVSHTHTYLVGFPFVRVILRLSFRFAFVQ